MKYKTALITGASSGIGREFAKQLAEQGVSLILIARRIDLLNELKEELASSTVNIELLQCDLCNREGLSDLLSLLKDKEFDLIVNNAGCGSFGYLETLDSKHETFQVDLNINATQQLMLLAISKFKQQNHGGVISVSSIAAFQPIPFMAAYAGTKVFNLYHSLAVSEEIRNTGVQVSILCPGPTATEFGGVARVPGTLTGGYREPVDKVVRIAIADFYKGKKIIIPGWRAKLMALTSRVLPLRVSTYITGKVLLPSLPKSSP